MTDWNLKINNIGGFRGHHEFIIKNGLNWILGDNATGKTSIINSFKLLNKINLNKILKDNDDRQLKYQDFLNEKKKNASIDLINEGSQYHFDILSPVNKITSFLDENMPTSKKRKNLFISKNSNIMNFAFIDKNNKLMESIEYSGTIELIIEEIIRISNISIYELLQKNVKKLNFEYNERKENELSKLNDNRKELELEIRKNQKELSLLEKELGESSVNDEISEEVGILKVDLEDKNREYNSLYFKEFNNVTEELNKLIVLLEKDKEKLQRLKEKIIELNDFISLENNIVENEAKTKKFYEDIENLKKLKSQISIDKRGLDNQIKLLKETVELGETNDICPHCLNPIKTKKITEKIDELEIERSISNEKIKEFDKDINILTKERDNLDILIINQKNIPRKISDLTSTINNLQKKIENNETKKVKLEKEKKVKNGIITKIRKELDEIHQKIISLSGQDNVTKEKHTILLTKINLIKEKNEEINSKKNLLVQKILILPENYKKLIKRTEILIDKLNEYTEAFYLKFIDSLNTELEILVKKLGWNFQEIFIDDNLKFNVVNKDGKHQKFNSLSDFEKKSIAILILLVLKMKYFPDYPIFAIDEHLNSADSQRLLNFIPHLYENIIKDNIKFFIITSLPNEVQANYLNKLDSNQYDNITIFYKN